jgi:hypothetical protein
MVVDKSCWLVSSVLLQKGDLIAAVANFFDGRFDLTEMMLG